MDNRSNEYFSEALRIADDLMGLANDEAGLADESGCGILFGVMRDCAYKIRRHAQQEGRKAKVAWVHANVILVIFTAVVLSIGLASPVNATIIMSTSATETVSGLSFGKGDFIEYNPTTGTATLYFDQSHFASGASIDAVHITSMPEPTTIALLGLGCLVLIGRNRR